ncbi:TPA: hypothetical protein EYN98_24950 [Candidatus Poribacteria bacterium]|nr:hypothetical protein [Candidatus Poribacteria bacterium]HIB85636.1 hypothetical protein [Candidatus Poribacteria bacterium]HIB99957.1 hypothetical protein [Candidatus Poribacteria bacterium]HIC19438.1 hypothetical protein [Candidatus Poribacteria bacterium]HIN29517.1 hypothetical protein [Candidatus Poribacteria bacterium]
MSRDNRTWWQLPNRVDYFIVGTYVVLLALVLRKHEPWADEAQAWLIARDSGLFELLFQRLRYEGHPGLWYLILMIPSRIFPYYPTIQIVAFLIAVSGVYVFVRTSPFPVILKILFPFTYFIFYQYAIVARSYVLLPLLIFLIGSLYPRKSERIYLFTLLLCLLAYTSVFSALIAISTMLVHFLNILQVWKELEPENRRRQMRAFVAFALFLLLMAIQLWQPPNSSFARNYHFGLSRITSMFLKVSDEILFEVKPLSYLALAISCLWFWSRRVLLLYLLSSLSIILLFAIKYYNSWHQGILFLAWILPMWISFQRLDSSARISRIYFSRIAITTFAGVFILHMYWAYSSSISDYHGSYSGGQAVANYIEENNLSDTKIYATRFWSTSILPFFGKNIFANHNNGRRPAFWFWSDDNKHNNNLVLILEEQPDLIIIGRPAEPLSEIDGYQAVGLFESNLYWKNQIKEKNHFAIYLKTE